MELTAASKITLLRILLTPFIIYAMINQSWVIALVLFAMAIITDFLDGYVARKYNQTSQLGVLLDPVADKILLISTLGLFLYWFDHNRIIQGLLLFLIAKELILLIGSAIVYSRYQLFFKPSKLSRLAGVAEMILIILLLAVSSGLLTISQPVLYGILFLFCSFSLALLIRYSVYLVNFFTK